MKVYLFTIAVLIALTLPAQAATYNPAETLYKSTVLDAVITDTKRQRDIPLRIYLPDTSGPAPLLLFSHGLGGSKDNNSYLGNHWAARGYIAAFMQHAGSDAKVWQDATLFDRRKKLLSAADGENLMLRIGDVSAVIDQLEKWNKLTAHDLGQRIDLEHIGMSGHSFGAVTTQAVSGQVLGGKSFADRRIDAAVLFSPSPPRHGKDTAAAAFGDVSIPWLLMTGTKDDSPLGIGISPEDRLKVFPALPAGNKYQIVFFGAEHSAFGDSNRLLKNNRNPNHHKVIMAVSTAFWDAHLRQDQAALRWLKDGGATSLLESKDSWQQK